MNRRDLFRLLIAAPLAAMVKVPAQSEGIRRWGTRYVCTLSSETLDFGPGGIVWITPLVHPRKGTQFPIYDSARHLLVDPPDGPWCHLDGQEEA